MAHEHNERCQELRDALAHARGRQTPPHRDTAVTGVQGITTLEPRDLTPDASPELEHEIRNIEQELRDLGCEPR